MPTIALTDYEQPNLDLERGLIEQAGWILQDHGPNCGGAEDVIARCQGADGAVCTYAAMTREVFEALPNLAIVSAPQIGVDTIDLTAARDHGIWVANVPDGNITEVAAHAMAMMLSMVRALPAYDRHVRQGGWHYAAVGSLQRPGTLTLGLLGCGRIARLVAGHGTGLFKDVIAHDPFVPAEAWPEGIGRASDLAELLARADILSLHAPMTPETKGVINSDSLAAMKPGAFLLNLARGPLVDEAALLRALDDGHIAGAALDVFQEEPPAPDNPLLKHERVLLSPHAAFYSQQSEIELRRRAVENILALHEKGRPDDVLVEGTRKIG